ncbi:MAG TPA: nitroreductase family deazaflavin-dependent oxidoreductase [Candidatus Limnocylindrales bacterium]
MAPAQPAPPPAWLVRLNVAFLRRGLRIGSQHLLTVRGRRSGQPRSTPVSVVALEGQRYLVAAFDAAWVANLRAAGEGELRRGRTSALHRFEELPTQAGGPVLRAFLEQVPGGVRFFGQQSRDEIVAGADRYPVFRVD